MDYLKRYDKQETESFALSAITQSFSNSYGAYIKPKGTNNFDFVSEDGLSALEVTLVVPKNVMEAYRYEKEQKRGKQNLSLNKIKNVKLTDDGRLFYYYGGSVGEIKAGILGAIKEKKASKRKSASDVEKVDLCICIEDGGLFNLQTFERYINIEKDNVFENIFFITSRFIRYNKDTGFEEYKLIFKT